MLLLILSILHIYIYYLLIIYDFYSRLCPYLYDLAYLNPTNTKNYVEEILKEKYDKFAKNRKRYPGMDTVRNYI